jgi:NAD(P)-dependent dehydrogenase (short-subunit alcohol dehydrogenase family)
MTVLDKFALTGRKALVTGGNRGIGEAIARGLAEAGADVLIAARDDARNDESIARAAADGLSVRSTVADITRDTDVEAMAEHAIDTLGGVDILVNDAGICFHRSSWEVPDAEWDLVFDLNVRALWKTSVAVGRHMRARGGSIVNIGSISAMIVNRPQFQAAYNASKAAVHQLTRSLAAEWAPDGIRVNAVAPGYIKPRWLRSTGRSSSECGSRTPFSGGTRCPTRSPAVSCFSPATPPPSSRARSWSSTADIPSIDAAGC